MTTRNYFKIGQENGKEQIIYASSLKDAEAKAKKQLGIPKVTLVMKLTYSDVMKLGDEKLKLIREGKYLPSISSSTK